MYTRDSTLLEKLIVEELKKLRKLSLEKKSLYQLLKEKEPSVKTEDGRHYLIERT